MIGDPFDPASDDEAARFLDRLANDPNMTSEDIAASFSAILGRPGEQRTRARMLVGVLPDGQ